MRRDNLVIGFLVAIVLTAVPAVLRAVVPIDSGTPSVFFPVTIDSNPGDQFLAKIDGNTAAYVAPDGFDDTIAYYDFFNGGTNVVPRPSADSVVDYWPSISGSKIAFLRWEVRGFEFGDAILVYDIATGVTTEVKRETGNAFHFDFPAIGGNTVAYRDLTVDNSWGEMSVANLADPGAGATRLTFNAGTPDERMEEYPVVSPSGNVIVWRSCEVPFSNSNCDIEKATFSGGSWTVARITTTTDIEDWPDTDGSLIVYNKYAPPNPVYGDSKVCWQPVSGGAEQCLEMDGSQQFASVADGLIAFTSVPPGAQETDLWVYHVATNRLFRITSTQGVDEQLPDLAHLPDGSYRVVWNDGVIANGNFDRNVYGATFELPPVVTPISFGGFLQPIDSYPTLNVMKAGSAVPVKFSLGGFHGLDIFAPGYPKSQVMNCGSSVLESAVEQTVNAGGSSLSYDAASDTYSYIWKTEKNWAGTCRQLVIQLTDLSPHYANFKFK